MRRRVRLFVSRDRSGASCRASSTSRATATRRRCGVAVLDALRRAFGGSDVDFTVLVTECGDGAPARRGAARPTAHAGRRRRSRSRPSSPALARAWVDDLHDAFVAARGEEAGLDAFRTWRDAFPPAYQADVDARARGRRRRRARGLGPTATSPSGSSRPTGDGVARIKLYRVGRAAGAVRRDAGARAPRRDRRRRAPVRDHARRRRAALDLLVRRARRGRRPARPIPTRRRASPSCSSACGRATIENDGLNRLVLRAGLDRARRRDRARARASTCTRPGCGSPRRTSPTRSRRTPTPVRLDRRPVRRSASTPRVRRGRRGREPTASTAELGARDRRGREPRRGPHPARARRTSSRAAVRTNAYRGASRTWRCKFDPDRARLPPRAAAAPRDLGVRRRASKACTCAVATSRAAASAGPTGATTSAPRSSG